MWAGYRDGIIGTVVVLAAMGARTARCPKQPLARPAAVWPASCSILFAVFLDNETAVFVSELVAGIVLLVGVGLFASGRRD